MDWNTLAAVVSSIVALAGTLGGLIFVVHRDGRTTQRMKDMAEDIDKLQNKVEDQARQLTDGKSRFTKLETLMEVLLKRTERIETGIDSIAEQLRRPHS